VRQWLSFLGLRTVVRAERDLERGACTPAQPPLLGEARTRALALVHRDTIHLAFDLNDAVGTVVDVHGLPRVGVVDHDRLVAHLVGLVWISGYLGRRG
jgi:hypothetical protein